MQKALVTALFEELFPYK